MAKDRIAGYLANKLQKAPCRLGQVLISGDLCLRHIDDSSRKALVRYMDPHDAIEIAKYDDGGKYRPLKTAPDLRRGWLLELKNIRQIVLALDFLYPAALGTALAQECGAIDPVALRKTLERQTGMYAVVKKITDAQASQLIAGLCQGQPGCMRRILWDISRERQLSPDLAEAKKIPPGECEIPLWCAEACNLLVAAGRETIKKSA